MAITQLTYEVTLDAGPFVSVLFDDARAEVGRVDRLANIMKQGREEKFLVIASLVTGQLDDSWFRAVRGWTMMALLASKKATLTSGGSALSKNASLLVATVQPSLAAWARDESRPDRDQPL